jgi:hypothetical protein
MADDQPSLTGAAALRAQLRTQAPVQAAPTPVQTDQAAPTQGSAPVPLTGAAALRAAAPPLPGAVQSPASDTPKTWADVARGAPHQLYQGAIEGGAGMLGLPAIAEHAIGAGLSKLGVDIPDNALTRFLAPHTASEMLGEAQKSIGYDPTQPKDLSSQVIRGAGQATASLPLGEAMGMTRLANAGYTYLPAAVGDVWHHETGTNPLWASLPAALSLTGAARLWGESGARQAATQAAEQAAKEQAEATAARQAHDVMAPDESQLQKAQTRGTQQVAKAFKKGSVADIENRYSTDTGAADTQLQGEHTGADADREAAAAKLGTSKTLEEGTGKMQDQARQWLGTEFKPALSKAEDGMFYKNPADHSQGTLVPQDAEGDATHLKGSIEHSYVTGAGVEGEPIAAMFRSRLPEAVNAKLDALAKAQGLPEGAAPKFTFADLRNIRSAIGDAAGDPSVISGIGVKKLNEMYRGVNDDIRAAVGNSAGQQGLDAFDKFNKEATRLFGVAGTVGDNIVTTTNLGKETITPKMLADNNGLWNDSTKINQLRSEPTLDKGVNEVAASKLRAGGRDTETAYDKLPEAKTAMFGKQAPALNAITARRTAAESAAADAKAAADKQRAQLLKDTQEAKQDISAHGAALRDVDINARAKTKIGLSQTEENAKAKTQELTAWAKELQRRATSVGGREFPFWIRNMPSLASGYLGGQHLLNEFGMQMPDWGQQLMSGAAGFGAYGMTQGAKELYHNPHAVRNLLQAGVASAPPSAPNKLGFSVTQNK